MYLRYLRSAFLVIVSSLVAANGAVKTWTGAGGTGNWGTTANWAPAGAPANGDDLVFPAGAPFLNNTNTLSGRTFNSISFSGASGGYNLRGNPITLTAGITASHTGGANDVEISLTLGGDQTFGTASGAGLLFVNGNINCNGNRLTIFANTATIALNGSISGAGSLTKQAGGILIIGGTNPNTYTGDTLIRAGFVQLNKATGPAIPGDLTVFSVLTLFGPNQVADDASVTLDGATFDLNNNNDTIGALTLTDSTVDSGSGTLTLGGNLTANGPGTINGNLHLGSFTRTFNVTAGATDLDIFANVSGGISGIFPNLVFAGITKTGHGSVTFWGTNTFSGTVTMNQGDIYANSDTAFGSIGGGVIVNNGIMRLNFVQIPNEPLTINVDGRFSILSLSSSWSGPITLNSNAMFNSTGTLILSNAISGPGGLSLYGDIVEFAGTNDNTYAGGTVSVADLLRLNKTGADAIPGDLTIGESGSADDSDVVQHLQNFQIVDASDVRIECSGLLNYNGQLDTIATLTLQGGSVETGSGTLFLNGFINVETGGSGCKDSRIGGRLNLPSGTHGINFPVGSLTLFAPDLHIDAQVLGAGSIAVGGNSGDLFLNASNSFNGTFNVAASGSAGLMVQINDDFALGTTTAGTTIGDGSTLYVGLDVTTVREPLTLCGAGTFGDGALLVNGGATWATNIVLGCDSIIYTLGGAVFTVNGVISGPGGFRKIGPGIMTLSGNADNTYAGDTIIDAGLLQLSKSGAVAIRNGALTVGDDKGGVNVDVVRYAAGGNQIQVSVPITIFGSGLLDLNGAIDEIGPLTLLGGDVSTGTGSATLGGNVTSLPSTNTLSILSGRLNVGATRAFNITNGGFSPDVRIDAQVVGAGGLIKNGAGELNLTSSNAYAGLTTVNGGLLGVENDFALGQTSNGTVVNTGGSVVLFFNSHVGLEPLSLGGDGGFGSIGALDGRFGSNSWAGPIVINTNSRMTINAVSDSLNLSGALSGPGNIVKEGAGTLIFSGAGANTFNDMHVNAGTLLLAKTVANAAIAGDLFIGDGGGEASADVVRLFGTSQITALSALHIATSGLFDLNDVGENVGSVDGFGRIDLGTASLGTGGNNNSGTYGGVIVGTGGLAKNGTGTLVLTANNTYIGATTIGAGILAINGSQPQSHVTLTGSGTLAGDGTVGNVTGSGNVSPNGNALAGAAPATLTTSNVAFAAAADFFVEINGSAPGSGYDQLAVRGTNNLGGATLHVAVGPQFAPIEGEAITIIDNDGAEAVTGTFAGLPNGSLITAGGLQFRILYGNDVTLRVTNTALRVPSISIGSGGNSNGSIDTNECFSLTLSLTNVFGGPVTGISAALLPTSPGLAVTQPFSTYPDMAANQRATNETPFQISVLPGYLCGTNLRFSLVIQTDANGSFTVPLTLPSGIPGPAVRFNNDVPAAIPDLGTLNSTMNVSGIETPIRQVMVSMHITHTAASDLDISLIAPDGTTVDLSSDNGGTASDYGTDCSDAGRTVFRNPGSGSITAASAPFVGTFSPEQSLVAFNGNFGPDVNGVWTLRVVDDAGGAVGTLRCWSLFISSATCIDGGGACESCPERTIFGSISDRSSVQAGRLLRNGVVSSCGAIKTCPGDAIAGAPRFHDSYVFQNGESNACITITLSTECALFSAAYRGAYNPLNLCQNYLADIGESGGTNSYSFNVLARERFVVVVNQAFPTDLCDYRLDVTGGSCRPVLDIANNSPTQVVLDWTTAAVGYRLERTNNLPGAPGLWLPVSTTPTVTNGQFRVLQNSSGGAQFYRLRKQ